MSHDVLQIIKNMNMRDLEIQIAIQCAPLLSGIKISNLLIVHRSNAKHVIELFQDSGISFSILCKREEKITFLLYRETELTEYLLQKEARELLKLLGYGYCDLYGFLIALRLKYEQYMGGGDTFPHELGLALGYPVEDVYGFIVNKGQKPLLVGYWKVYENAAEKQKIFEQFNEAKETMIRLVSQGASILDIIGYGSAYNYSRRIRG
ncbi:DUF3793 family protein [Konateibacter massiliensis]|uniref:DUF3793 family protein n=1 Tax=Konateibacter massiliensis TaxID=2002841 RepID=UPI000C160F50|nr:DUF3793 family protein [Konateibacter massiliensis]